MSNSSSSASSYTSRQERSPYLDPDAVRAMAAGLPNCRLITPPSQCDSAGGSYGDRRAAPAGGDLLSEWRAKLRLGFGVERDKDMDKSWRDVYNGNQSAPRRGNGWRNEVILSFLVSDPNYVIESLSDDVGEMEGAGVARVDVYCYSGTVCTCRLIQTADDGQKNDNNIIHGDDSEQESADAEEFYQSNFNSKGNSILSNSDEPFSRTFSLSPTNILSSIMTTPRHGNITGAKKKQHFHWTISSASFSPETPTSSFTSRQQNHAINSNNNLSNSSSNKNLLINTQVRRIFRRKCTMEGLRSILKNPPKITKVHESLVHGLWTENNMKTSNYYIDSSTNSASTAVQTPKQRHRKSKLTVEQQRLTVSQRRFLRQEQKKYLQRIRREEKLRERVANVVLSGEYYYNVTRGSPVTDATYAHSYGKLKRCSDKGGGNGDFLVLEEALLETKDTLESVESTTWDEEDVNDEEVEMGGSQILQSLSTNGIKNDSNSLSKSHEVSSSVSDLGSLGKRDHNDVQMKQREIQQKIELADIGLAILMGEAEALEKMMELLEKEQEEMDNTETENDCSDDFHSKGDGSMPNFHRNHSPHSGTRNNLSEKQRRRECKKNSRIERVRERSVESQQSRARRPLRRDSFSTLDYSSCNGSHAEEVVRTLHGCEVEYSFPHEYHDDLEDELLAQEYFSQDEKESFCSSVDGNSASKSRGYDDDLTLASRVSDVSMRRGRSPTIRGNNRKNSSAVMQRHRRIPNIVAVPTNGYGCIVLRENGGFGVIGKIPKPLNRQLFRPKGPLPEYIALGTKGRYYVRFQGGATKYNGPPSLSRFLTQGQTTNDTSKWSTLSRKKKKNSGKHLHCHNQSVFRKPIITCVTFGKNFEDFFLVREDGSWEAGGTLCRGLEKLLTDRRDRDDLEWVALGPHNEWCLKAKNGRIWWGGVSDEIDKLLGKILINDDEDDSSIRRDLKFIDFGIDDSFFLLHR